MACGLAAQSVTEEKQTRVVEILVATIPVRVLLAGKVTGGAVLAFGQIALVAAVSVVGAQLSGAPDNVLTVEWSACWSRAPPRAGGHSPPAAGCQLAL